MLMGGSDVTQWNSCLSGKGATEYGRAGEGGGVKQVGGRHHGHAAWPDS